MSFIAAEIPQLSAMQTFLLASALKSLNGISTFSASCGLDSETVSLTISPEEDSELLFNSSRLIPLSKTLPWASSLYLAFSFALPSALNFYLPPAVQPFCHPRPQPFLYIFISTEQIILFILIRLVNGEGASLNDIIIWFPAHCAVDASLSNLAR